MKLRHFFSGQCEVIRWSCAIINTNCLEILPSREVIFIIKMKGRASQIENFCGERDEMRDLFHLLGILNFDQTDLIQNNGIVFIHFGENIEITSRYIKSEIIFRGITYEMHLLFAFKSYFFN